LPGGVVGDRELAQLNEMEFLPPVLHAPRIGHGRSGVSTARTKSVGTVDNHLLSTAAKYPRLTEAGSSSERGLFSET
jgi:hypothetical protein